MSWEQRGNQLYYYHKRRVGHCVVSEYVGAGILAELQARDNELNQQIREQERWAWADERAKMVAIDSDLDALSDFLQDLTRASLLLAGYHPHRRQWRKKRHAQ